MPFLLERLIYLEKQKKIKNLSDINLLDVGHIIEQEKILGN